RDTGLEQRDRAVHPIAGLLVSVLLGLGRAADAEGAVVARAVADVRMDDVEERLVAGADQAVSEVVRMRIAALARDRVDRLDAVRAHAVEAHRRHRDDVALANAGL